MHYACICSWQEAATLAVSLAVIVGAPYWFLFWLNEWKLPKVRYRQ